MPALPPRDLWDRLLVASIFAGMLALAYAAFATTLLEPLFAIAVRDDWHRLWLRPTIIWISMGMLLLLVRTLLWLAYRPFAAAAPQEAPSLTVIVPAYNEGEMVEHAIASIAAADYPRERLEILAIDDGSSDDTWRYIERAARRFPGLVTAIRLPENRGKRGALAEGFRRAQGEIVVTVDSDSVIERQTLLAIAGPFRDPRVGAVAGKVAVHNRLAGLIPRMLLAIMVVSTLYALYYLRSERSWDFAYGILYGYFSFFALTWIFPYAVLTIRARGWLTR